MNEQPNPMNQVAPLPPKESMISPGLLVTFIIVVLAAAGYFGWNYFGKSKTTEEATPAPVTTSSTSGTKPAAATANPTVATLVYTNDAYGFTMTFPSAWKDYKMKEASVAGSTKTYYIELPTKDSAVSGGITADTGYFSPFAVSVYTLDQWTAAQAEEGVKDTLIIKGEKYAFGWSQANGVMPTDFLGANDIKTIIASFKLK